MKNLKIENIILIFASLCLVFSVLLFSSNMTGYAVSNLYMENVNTIGIILFSVSIPGILVYIFLRKRRGSR